MAVTYAQLWNQYNRFEAPTCTLRLNGVDPFATGKWELLSLRLSLSSGVEAGALLVELSSQEPAQLPQFAQTGAKVTCALGYGMKQTVLFLGCLYRLSFRREKSRCVCTLEALDAKGLMMNGNRMEFTAPQKLSQTLKAVLNAPKYATFLSSVKMDAVEAALDVPVCFNGESDFEFLSRMAHRLNYEFVILNGALRYGHPAKGSPDLLLDASNDLRAFEWTASLAHQVRQVTASSHDDMGKQISGQAERSFQKQLGGCFPNALLGEKLLLNFTDTAAPAALRELARARMARLEAEACRCRGKTVLLPDLVPGKTVGIQNAAGSTSASFRVTDIEHFIGREGASMWFEGYQID